MVDEVIETESQVESVVPLEEILANQDDYVLINIKSITVCNKCHQRLTWKRTPKYISMRCGCGCRLWYPKDEKGVILSTFVTKQQREDSNGRRKC